MSSCPGLPSLQFNIHSPLHASVRSRGERIKAGCKQKSCSFHSPAGLPELETALLCFSKLTATLRSNSVHLQDDMWESGRRRVSVQACKFTNCTAINIVRHPRLLVEGMGGGLNARTLTWHASCASGFVATACRKPGLTTVLPFY